MSDSNIPPVNTCVDSGNGKWDSLLWGQSKEKIIKYFNMKYSDGYMVNSLSKISSTCYTSIKKRVQKPQDIKYMKPKSDIVKVTLNMIDKNVPVNGVRYYSVFCQSKH